MNTLVECRSMQIKMISARDLKDGITNVYAKVSLSKDTSERRFETKPDETGGNNPKWVTEMSFHVEESKLQYNKVKLVFELYEKRCPFICDKKIGKVKIALKDLFNKGTDEEFRHDRNLSKRKGIVEFSYRFSPDITAYSLPGPLKRGMKLVLKATLKIISGGIC
ncbi:PREDICTED: protein SRC2 homolog [Nelumbo nucifera]|uniref:C2 domain-containing protein n=2 Tax=Nelumbo nucifera TaxID=4432 RepID=A0A822ZQA4_NELNU|nr:PREDICTED: protein SRC2 homolog [Nelumbo nucifera]DAD45529.1 TPA_asm: hypothetical protein HUJ06_003759 [Nelumbo nucifera]